MTDSLGSRAQACDFIKEQLTALARACLVDPFGVLCYSHESLWDSSDFSWFDSICFQPVSYTIHRVFVSIWRRMRPMENTAFTKKPDTNSRAFTFYYLGA